MKRLLCLIILLAVFMGCTVAKRTVFLETPMRSLTPRDSIDLSSYQQKYSNYDGVYLNFKEYYEHSGVKDKLIFTTKWTYTVLTSYKYLVLDNSSPKAKSFGLPYKPDNFYVRIITPDHKLTSYGLSDLEEEIDAKGDKDYRLVYPDIPNNTIIEVGYATTFNMSPYFAITDYDIPLQFVIPCENFELKFIYPEWWEISVKEIALGRSVKYTHDSDPDNKKNIISYSANYIPAVAIEPYSPDFKQMAQYLEFMVTDLSMGDSEMDRPQSWDEIGEKFYKNMLKSFDKMRLNIKAGTNQYSETAVYNLIDYVENIFKVKKPANNFEKAQIIVEYIQDEIEVSYKNQKGSANKIINSGTGSVYDITSLTKAMLEAAGFKAEYLLVHSSEDGYFDMSYVHHDQLYTPAVKLTLDGNTYLIFPYMEYLPIDQLPKRFQKQQAMIINGKKEINFWTTPDNSLGKDIIIEDYNFTVNESGTIQVSETKTYHGLPAFVLREELSKKDEEKTKEFCHELLEDIDGEVNELAYEINNLDSRYDDLVIKLDYTIDNIASITPDEIILPTLGLLSSYSSNKYLFDKDVRINPIEIVTDEVKTRNIMINYPEQWQLSTTFEDISFENIFGSYSSLFHKEAGKISIKQQTSFNQIQQPKEKYPDFLNVYDTEKSQHIPVLIFSIEQI